MTHGVDKDLTLIMKNGKKVICETNSTMISLNSDTLNFIIIILEKYGIKL